MLVHCFASSPLLHREAEVQHVPNLCLVGVQREAGTDDDGVVSDLAHALLKLPGHVEVQPGVEAVLPDDRVLFYLLRDVRVPLQGRAPASAVKASRALLRERVGERGKRCRTILGKRPDDKRSNWNDKSEYPLQT